MIDGRPWIDRRRPSPLNEGFTEEVHRMMLMIPWMQNYKKLMKFQTRGIATALHCIGEKKLWADTLPSRLAFPGKMCHTQSHEPFYNAWVEKAAHERLAAPI